MSAAAVDVGIEPWELHSELVLVCPEVWRRARELLPERDPDAFLAGLRQPIALPPAPADEAPASPRVLAAVALYTLRRLLHAAGFGFVTAGGLAALASLAELVH